MHQRRKVIFFVKRLRDAGGGRASHLFSGNFNYLPTTFLFVDGFYSNLAKNVRL